MEVVVCITGGTILYLSCNIKGKRHKHTRMHSFIHTCLFKTYACDRFLSVSISQIPSQNVDELRLKDPGAMLCAGFLHTRGTQNYVVGKLESKHFNHTALHVTKGGGGTN